MQQTAQAQDEPRERPGPPLDGTWTVGSGSPAGSRVEKVLLALTRG